MIFAEDLTKQFDEFLAVDGINLNVKAGEVLVLLGPNGAGKTTTVRMLTSILRPTRGKASIAGYDVVEHPDKVRASVGVLTENHGLYNRMNAVEYLMFFASLYNLDGKIARKRMDALLDKFGLSHALSKRLGEYSKGMRQKLALVRALLHEPAVLLLDEPTSAMDPESARTVRDAIHHLKSDQRTIILCTHNLVEAEELADKIAIIRLGRIIFNDSPNNLKRQLLGPMEYEVHLANLLNGWIPDMPDGVELLKRTENTLRFKISQPEIANPVLMRQMMDHRLDIVAFQEVARSLEDAYLQAVSRMG
jgi:ABC-2 type transport system ATP-binding protein